jgi:hypothetical protein
MSSEKLAKIGIQLTEVNESIEKACLNWIA